MESAFENGCLVKDESRGVSPPPFLESTFENGCLVRMKAGAVVFEQSYVLLAQSIAPV